MAHESKVEKDEIFFFFFSWAHVELEVKISELSLRKVATTGKRSTLFVGGGTSQNFLNMSTCYAYFLSLRSGKVKYNR